MSALKPIIKPLPLTMICDQARELIDTIQEFDAADGLRKRRLYAILTERLDALLLVLNRIDGEFTENDIKIAFNKFRLVPDDLVDLNPAIIPMVVVRELLSTYHISVDRSQLANWQAFEDRYIEALCS